MIGVLFVAAVVAWALRRLLAAATRRAGLVRRELERRAEREETLDREAYELWLESWRERR